MQATPPSTWAENGFPFPDLWGPEDARAQSERLKPIVQAVKALEGQRELKPKAEEPPHGGGAPGLGDLVNLLLRIEEKVERIEQKLDRLNS